MTGLMLIVALKGAVNPHSAWPNKGETSATSKRTIRVSEEAVFLEVGI